jgi:hypothetical protein
MPTRRSLPFLSHVVIALEHGRKRTEDQGGLELRFYVCVLNEIP